MVSSRLYPQQHTLPTQQYPTTPTYQAIIPNGTQYPTPPPSSPLLLHRPVSPLRSLRFLLRILSRPVICSASILLVTILSTATAQLSTTSRGKAVLGEISGNIQPSSQSSMSPDKKFSSQLYILPADQYLRWNDSICLLG